MLVLLLLFGLVSSLHSTQLNKCCPFGQQWTVKESSPVTCDTARSAFKYPPIYSSLGVQSNQNIDLVHEPLTCDFLFSLLPDRVEEERYQILDTGRLLYLNGEVEEEFCLESIDDRPDPEVFVCIGDSSHKKAVDFLFLPIGSGLSFLCLLALLFVYVIVEELHNSPGIFLMNHALALALGYLVLIVGQISGSHIQWHNLCSNLVIQTITLGLGCSFPLVEDYLYKM